MARVNLEERCFSERRLRALATAMGWNEREALGTLAYLWHGSQESLKLACSYLEAITYTLLDDEVGKKFIEQCVRFGYLKEFRDKNDQLLYEITGNKEQIKWRKSAKEKAKKGGEANKKRLQLQASSKLAPSYLQASPIQCNTIQGNYEEDTNVSFPNPAPSVPLIGSADCQNFLKLWNDKCGSLPKAEKLTESRKKKIKKRLTDKSDLSYWTTCIEKLAASDFCTSGNWANIDWLIGNDTNHVKAFEGKYDNKTGGFKNSQQRANRGHDPEHAKKMDEWARQERRRLGIE